MVDFGAPTGRPVATRLIAIATSAGGLDALSEVLRRLPAGLEAAVLVVQHLEPKRVSHLAHILGGRTPLIVTEAEAGVLPVEGTVYVAPPGTHLIVGLDCRTALSDLPPLHFCRPSGDRLFASVAASFGRSAIGVVLTGKGRDGADGAQIIRASGGVIVLQEVPGALHAGMPRAAAAAGPVDWVLPLQDIGAKLQALVAQSVAA